MDITNIPEQWAKTKGWMPTKGKTKRPMMGADKADLCPTLDKLPGLVNITGGFATSWSNPIAILDVDNCIPSSPLFPDCLVSLIRETYTEYSLSGNGLHIVFTTDKEKLPYKGYIKTKNFPGQLSLKNNFMVTTGNKLPDSPSILAHIPVERLKDILGGLTPLTPLEQEIQKRKYKKEVVDDKAIHMEKVDEESDHDESNDSKPVPPVPPSGPLVPPSGPLAPPIHSQTTTQVDADVPSLPKFRKMVAAIPIDQSDRVKRVYEDEFGQAYEHYHFWLTIGMAIHDYGERIGQITQALDLYLSWSALDPVSYESDEDVLRKWESFHNDPKAQQVTYKTVIKLANIFSFNYPKRVYDSRAKKLTPYPILTEYENFEYLLDKFHIQLYSMNNLTLFVKGDEDIISKYFMLDQVHNLFGYCGPMSRSKLYAATLLMCQASNWKGLSNTKNLVDIWIEQKKPTVDVFYEWLNTPSEQLPDELKFPRYSGTTPVNQLTTFEDLESCIEWDTDNTPDAEEIKALYRKMLFATFMQLIKLHEPTMAQFEDNGGFFALIGPENTYKTTFFKLLLPLQLEFLRKEQNQELVGEKNKRDFVRNLSSAAILLVDEFEGFMDHKKSGSFFKAVISSNTTSFTDIYQTEEQNLKRRAILVGTSNDYMQIVSDNGSRRLWYTKIKKINTTKMLSLNLHAVYTDLRERFKAEVALGHTPWLLSREEIMRVTEHNKLIRTKSSIDYDLEELFPYTTQYDIDTVYLHREMIFPKKAIHALPQTDDSGTPTCGRFLKTQHVIKLLTFNGYKVPPTAELNRALTRFCMEFLGQRTRVVSHRDMVIESGRLCLYKKQGSYQHKLWVMPTEEDNVIKEEDDNNV